MKRYMNYIVIESQEDFNEHYDEKLQRLAYSYLEQIPTHFPVCYEYIPSPDPHYCGSWEECNVSDAINAWNEQIQKDIRFIGSVAQMFLSEENG